MTDRFESLDEQCARIGAKIVIDWASASAFGDDLPVPKHPVVQPDPVLTAQVEALSACHARPLVDAAVSVIVGESDASRLISMIRGDRCVPADALFEALEQIRATGDAARFRGACRQLQKILLENHG